MASDSEEMPPSGSAPPPTTTTTTAAGVGPPGPGAGISTTASSPPGIEAISLPGVPQQQFVISSFNSGAFSGHPPSDGGLPVQARGFHHGRARHVLASHYCQPLPAVQDF